MLLVSCEPFGTVTYVSPLPPSADEFIWLCLFTLSTFPSLLVVVWVGSDIWGLCFSASDLTDIKTFVFAFESDKLSSVSSEQAEKTNNKAKDIRRSKNFFTISPP